MDGRSTKSRLERLIWRCRCLISRKGANVLKNENAGEDLDGLRSLESSSLDKRPGGTSAGDGRQGKIPWSSDSSNPVEYSGEMFITIVLVTFESRLRQLTPMELVSLARPRCCQRRANCLPYHSSPLRISKSRY